MLLSCILQPHMLLTFASASRSTPQSPPRHHGTHVPIRSNAATCLPPQPCS
ncbi:hypothetical protein PF005_g7684 [Phytophthora fragariae]|uniref:RxLR effector protein n=1 Tax=Phytophthora fragariae TaxID=53985 RepID=A0A6A3F748_9STRA|nr:hypothetical protein PF003_g36389 [Phytophthora fragariae]KAE8941665.1 hypothetical protein PF009_g8542 [Phytophthora fragariae]KAE9005111.1 hypothetical protein PF011_g12175 [Phytophthora fragariae]KAE9106793.1 hypothetical protein PF010_g12495 [Phytophthora fragariae]KAE9108882.1 hypothetical protein PF007_g12472 [Phytophthora fragariae]